MFPAFGGPESRALLPIFEHHAEQVCEDPGCGQIGLDRFALLPLGRHTVEGDTGDRT